MAKNDPLPVVSFQRKDTFLLVDGTWYVSTPCPIHGLVDEEIPFTDAKTPHHAGLIADQRHLKCSLEIDTARQREYAEQEIAAAKDLQKNQAANLDRAKERLESLRVALPDGPAKERALIAAREAVVRHERGLQHAIRRLADTTTANRR